MSRIKPASLNRKQKFTLGKLFPDRAKKIKPYTRGNTLHVMVDDVEYVWWESGFCWQKYHGATTSE